MKKTTLFSLHTTFGLLAALALTLPSLHAASGTWTGLGNQSAGNAIWGGTVNWANGVADGVGFTATFGNSFKNGYFCTVNTNRTIGSIVYNDPVNANNFVIVRHASNLTLTLNNNGSPGIFDIRQSGRSVTVNPITAGTGGLTKIGPGILILTNENTISGPVRVDAGILSLSNILAMQSAVLDMTNTITGDADNGLRTTVTPLTIGGLTGNKALASVFSTNAGGYDTLGDLTLNPEAGLSHSYSGVIANGAAVMSITKIGEGTQTLAGANTYTGVTAVNAGTLNVSTAGSATSNVTVAETATFGAQVASNGGQWVNTGDLNFGNNSAVMIDYTSTVPSTTVAPVRVANLSATPGVAVRLAANNFAALAPGQTYPLITWTTSGPANALPFTLALPHRVTGNPVVSGNTISVNITANASGPLTWNRGDAAWDTVAANWLDAAAVPAPASFFDSLDSVLFGDAPGATGNPVVTLGSLLSPVAVIMNSTSRDYRITGAGGISGAASLTLDAANTRTLTMEPANNYAGNTVINGGTLKLGASEVIPDGTGTGNVTVNGTLDLNGFAENINGLSGSGTVDSTEAAGFPTLTVGGNNAGSTFGGMLKNTAGTLALIKTGTGRLILSGTNTNTGGTTIAAGILQVGAGGTTGSLGAGPVVNTGTLEFNRSDDTTFPDEISDTGALVKNGGGGLTLTNANTYSGATSVNRGTLTLSGDRTANCGAITVGSDGNTATLNLQGGTFTMNGTFTVGTGSAVSSGTVNHSNGSLTLSGTQLILGNLGALGNASTGTYNLSGGSLIGVSSTTRGIIIGTNPGTSGVFNLSGTGNLDLSTALLQVGRSEAATGGTTNLFNQTGGTAVVNILAIGGTGTGNTNSTLTLTGGTFTATTFPRLAVAANDITTINIGGTAEVTLPAFPTTRGTGAAATLSFNGGTLKPAAESAAYLGGLTNAFVRAGGARIDTTNGSVTISQALLTDPGSAGGGLTKAGLNTLTLTGANTYTGPTAISAGTLRFSTAASSASDITTTAGATHAVLVAAANGQWVNTGSLNLANNSAASIDYGTTAPSTTVAPMRVANFTPGTGVNLNLSVTSLASLVPGQSYPLITWTGSGPATSAGLNPVLPFRILGNLTVSENTLFLNVSGNAGPISWNTGNANWDTLSPNWLDAVSVAATFVNPMDSVVFGDAPGAGANPVITLPTALAPVAVTMQSTSRNYTITGTGSITGPASLTLDAANTRILTMASSNTYTGNTVIDGGTFRLGASSVIPDGTGAGNVSLNGTFDLNTFSETINGLTGTGTVDNTVVGGVPALTIGSNNATSTFGGVIRNTVDSVSLTKTGTGTLTLTGANAYSGGTTIADGTLRLGDGGTTGTPGTGLIANDGTLEFNRSNALIIADIISGTGALRQTGTGAVTLSGANTVTGAITVTAGQLNLTDWSSSPLGVVTVAGTSGATLNLSGTATWTIATRMFVSSTTSGTVNQTGGTLDFTESDALLVGSGTAGVGTFNLSGGTLTSFASSSRGVMLGVNAGCTGIFNLSGNGVLNMPEGTLQVGRSDSSVPNGVGIFNQTSGTAVVGTLAVGGNGASGGSTIATMNLTGGSFSAASFPRLGLGISDTVVINIGGSADVILPAFPAGRGFGTNTVTVTFNGGTLIPTGPSSVYMGDLTNAFIRAGGARFDTTNGDITITQPLLTDPVSTGGGLTKAGLNTLTLTSAATYSGNTTVAEGTLSLEAANPNNESSTVTLASIGSQLQLNYAGTDTVARLVTGTTQRVAGTYGHTDSGATNGGLGVGAMDAWFAPGTGILTVTFNPVAGGYGTWASANAQTGTPADDFDRDGVPNGVEYVLGGDRNTNDAGKLPQISSNGGNMVFTFQRSQASIDGSTTVVIETGTGLGTWPDTYPVPATALVNNPGVTVVKNSPAGFDTVTLAVPQAPDAIKFARLKVTVVP